MSLRRWTAGLLMAVVITGAATKQAEAADLTRLRAALKQVRFVAYTPRAFRPDPATRVTPADIAADLDLLQGSFDGLITYSTGKGLAAVPELAAARGFRAGVLGVWDPLDPAELDRAIALCRRFDRLVVGLSLGNEGIVSKRYTWPQLVAALDRVRRALPDLALTTGEPFAFLLEAPPQCRERGAGLERAGVDQCQPGAQVRADAPPARDGGGAHHLQLAAHQPGVG